MSKGLTICPLRSTLPPFTSFCDSARFVSLLRFVSIMLGEEVHSTKERVEFRAVNHPLGNVVCITFLVQFHFFAHCKHHLPLKDNAKLCFMTVWRNGPNGFNPKEHYLEFVSLSYPSLNSRERYLYLREALNTVWMEFFAHCFHDSCWMARTLFGYCSGDHKGAELKVAAA